MSLQPPLKLAYARFTSCSGCQLMLVNCEVQLAELVEWVVLGEFPLVSSASGRESPSDVALVEGSISTPEELSRLLELRHRTELLVAIGSCALTGGVNRQVKGARSDAVTSVYQQETLCTKTFPPQPLHHFVTVDWKIPGCPPERHDLVETLGAVLHGGWPGWQDTPVCTECRTLEYRCLLIEDRLPCLGPVTRSGCHARCPSIGVVCEGCRADVAEANRDELFRLLLETGLPEREARNRLDLFGGVGRG